MNVSTALGVMCQLKSAGSEILRTTHNWQLAELLMSWPRKHSKSPTYRFKGRAWRKRGGNRIRFNARVMWGLEKYGQIWNKLGYLRKNGGLTYRLDRWQVMYGWEALPPRGQLGQCFRLVATRRVGVGGMRTKK